MFNTFKSNLIVTATTFCAICATNYTAQAQEEELTPLEVMEQTIESQGSVISKLSKLKVSGYIQTQYQYGGFQADGVNFKLQNRLNAYEAAEEEGYGRIGIRRGRIKFTYEDGLVQGVFQPDITQNGVSFKDVYLSIKDPWFKSISLKAGIFDRPFGHEISYSSSTRESPERSRIFQTLFPDERDLGAMLTLQAPKTSEWAFIKLEGGLFAGNGIRPQFAHHLDFIGHLSATKTFDNISIGGGISCYIGGQLMFNGLDTTKNEDGSIASITPKPVKLYEMKDGKWEILKDNNYGQNATRQYFGIDFQFSVYKEGVGFTQLRAEYIMGTNPGGASNITLNPTALLTGDRYLRNIAGYYIIVTQDIPTLPLTLVAKYDWYNPNSGIAGDDITAASEIAFENVGLGLLWYANANIRVTAYYDIVSHETSEKLNGYKEVRDANVFTFRVQYKF